MVSKGSIPMPKWDKFGKTVLTIVYDSMIYDRMF